jgi:GWxTD domain-containing protein
MGNSRQFLHSFAAIVILFIIPDASLHAQNDAVWIDLLRFQGAADPYFEIQLEFESNAFAAIETENGWQTLARLEATLENADGIINYVKTTIAGPIESDSLRALKGTQLHIERMEAPAGDYRLNIVLADATDKGTFTTTSALGFALPRTGAPRWSDSFIVEAYAPSDTSRPSQLTRSGFDMLPVVGGRVGTQADRIQFYAELYDVHDVVDSLFLISCWIQNEKGQVEPGTQRFFRKLARKVVPLFTFTDSLALIQHVRDHRPRADASQRHIIEGFLNVATVGQMQAFLLSFWEEQASSNPELGWREYTTAIAYVDSAYGACRNSHGAETDMGYTYLRYGPPNTIIKRHNETDYYPYEIWHYHRAGPFTNKRFLFFCPHMVAECFVTLHSDMLGEVQNADWLHQLRNRENRLARNR